MKPFNEFLWDSGAFTMIDHSNIELNYQFGSIIQTITNHYKPWQWEPFNEVFAEWDKSGDSRQNPTQWDFRILASLTKLIVIACLSLAIFHRI